MSVGGKLAQEIEHIMPMTETDIEMLQQICKTVREEFISAIYISATKRWSPSSVQRVIKDALDQCSKIDEEMIKIAFQDLDEKIDDDGHFYKTKELTQV
jgi:RNA binding exosome subunit